MGLFDILVSLRQIGVYLKCLSKEEWKMRTIGEKFGREGDTKS